MRLFSVTLSLLMLIPASTLSVRGVLKAERGPEVFADWFCVEGVVALVLAALSSVNISHPDGNDNPI